MDAEKYLKEIYRMCDAMEDCRGCPLNRCNLTFPCKGSKESAEYKDTEKCVAEVEKWSAKHPVKTRQNEFLRMFPNAPLCENGSIAICPLDVDRDAKCSQKQGSRCPDCQKEYWFVEVE